MNIQVRTKNNSSDNIESNSEPKYLSYETDAQAQQRIHELNCKYLMELEINSVNPSLRDELKSTEGYEIYKQFLTPNMVKLFVIGVFTTVVFASVVYFSWFGLLLMVVPGWLFREAFRQFWKLKHCDPIGICKGTVTKLEHFTDGDQPYIFKVLAKSEDGTHIFDCRFPSRLYCDSNNVQNMNVGDTGYVFLTHDNRIFIVK